MPSINYQVGYKTFMLNEDPEKTLTINPTDAGFVKALFDAFNQLSGEQDDLEQSDNPDDVLTALDGLDAHIRAELDRVLGEGTCSKAFGAVNCTALADGMPVWVNFCLAILSVCEGEAKAAHEESRKKVEAYTRKFIK